MGHRSKNRSRLKFLDICYICGSVVVLIAGAIVLAGTVQSVKTRLIFDDPVIADIIDLQTASPENNSIDQFSITPMNTSYQPMPTQYVGNQFVFRNDIKFDMRKGDVMQNESAQLLSDQGDSVIYGVNFICPDYILLYTFRDNRLFSMTYTFGIRYDDYNDYIDDFRSVNEWLYSKYGTPFMDEVSWLDTTFQGLISNSTALAEGDIMYITSWKPIGDATVTHFMFLEDNVIMHCILYTPMQS